MFNILRKAFTRTGSALWLMDHYEPKAGVKTSIQMRDERMTLRPKPKALPSHPDYNPRVIRVREGTVTQQRLTDPLPFAAELSPGHADKADLREVLGFVRDAQERCTPWAETFMVPRFTADGAYVLEGEVTTVQGNQWAGMAVQADDGAAYTVMSTDTSPTSSRATWHHEAWHHLEHRLSAGAIERLQSSLAPWRMRGTRGYTMSPSERLARAYEWWAMHQDDMFGGTGEHSEIPTSGRMAYAYEAFSVLYSGEYVSTMRAHGLM